MKTIAILMLLGLGVKGQDSAKTLQGVQVVAPKSMSRMLNMVFPSGGCWERIDEGDTLINLMVGKPGEYLIDYVKRLIPDIEYGGMVTGQFSTKTVGLTDVPRYKGQEMGLFLNEVGAGGRRAKVTADDIFSIRQQDGKAVCIKFFKNFKCTTGSGPALCVYTEIKKQ